MRERALGPTKLQLYNKHILTHNEISPIPDYNNAMYVSCSNFTPTPRLHEIPLKLLAPSRCFRIGIIFIFSALGSFGDSFMRKMSSLHFESETRGQSIQSDVNIIKGSSVLFPPLRGPIF